MKTTLGSRIIGTLIGHRPWMGRYRQYSYCMSRWYRNVPFHLDQKVLCVRNDEYNHKTKDTIYTISGFSKSTSGYGWFLAMEESGVSSWWGNFSPLNDYGSAIYENGWPDVPLLRACWMDWNRFAIKLASNEPTIT